MTCVSSCALARAVDATSTKAKQPRSKLFLYEAFTSRRVIGHSLLILQHQHSVSRCGSQAFRRSRRQGRRSHHECDRSRCACDCHGRYSRGLSSLVSRVKSEHGSKERFSRRAIQHLRKMICAHRRTSAEVLGRVRMSLRSKASPRRRAETVTRRVGNHDVTRCNCTRARYAHHLPTRTTEWRRVSVARHRGAHARRGTQHAL